VEAPTAPSAEESEAKDQNTDDELAVDSNSTDTSSAIQVIKLISVSVKNHP
jgi:hypothetical protein